MYNRLLEKTILTKLFCGKAIIITGARQTGKTTLIKRILSVNEVQLFNCDNPTDRKLLNDRDLIFLQQLIGNKKIVFIDEGQKVSTIGQTVKLLVDHYGKEKQILVTGSSSINLLDSIQETLTGRKFVYTLYPLSLEEIYSREQTLDALKNLSTYLLFGNYPEVVSLPTFAEKIELLMELHNSSLFKDIFEFQRIKNPIVLRDLLKALALQLGSEVSYHELSNLLGIDKKTVERYIDLLEKNFLIYRLSPYTTHQRRELSKLKKIYFYDLGIRNALLNNFNFLDSRNDVGALWENFVITERLKYRTYHKIYADQYFWRTYDGSEIDLVEESAGQLRGYEIKWSEKKRATFPLGWQGYGNSSYTLITPTKLSGFVF